MSHSDQGQPPQDPPGYIPFERGSRQEYEAQIRGTIYGNCIGDAIGLLTEFMNKKQAEAQYPGYREGKGLEYEDKVEDGHRSRWAKGDWTDDSDQMILIMDSILDCKGQIVPVDYGKKLLRWSQQGFPELGDYGGMGIGSTTYQVLHHPQYKQNPWIAAEDVWQKSGCVVAPNGAVMRTSILGIYEFDNLDKVYSNSIDMAKVTHADPRCLASCIAVTSAIAFMLRKRERHFNQGKYDVQAITRDSYDSAKPVFNLENKHEKAWCKDLKNHMFVRDIRDLYLEEHNKIGYTLKALGAGFWALRQNDFRQALETITMEAGDADTNGAVAGALLGCKLYDRLPKTWFDGLVHKDWLDRRIDRFLEFMWSTPPANSPPPAGTAAAAAAAGREDQHPSGEHRDGHHPPGHGAEKLQQRGQQPAPHGSTQQPEQQDPRPRKGSPLRTQLPATGHSGSQGAPRHPTYAPEQKSFKDVPPAQSTHSASYDPPHDASQQQHPRDPGQQPGVHMSVAGNQQIPSSGVGDGPQPQSVVQDSSRDPTKDQQAGGGAGHVNQPGHGSPQKPDEQRAAGLTSKEFHKQQ